MNPQPITAALDFRTAGPAEAPHELQAALPGLVALALGLGIALVSLHSSIDLDLAVVLELGTELSLIALGIGLCRTLRLLR